MTLPRGGVGARAVRSALVVATVRVLVSAVVLVGGFRAVSDDDFARVTIAQRFALSPSLDPSSTSWLPAPFWLTGSVMAIFGRALEVAQATAFVTGIASALVVWVGAAWLTGSRTAALLGAVLGAAFPYAAWLGVATVPDYPTAALLVLAMASVVGRDPMRRLIGGASLLFATLSRYEAWPVALVFGILSAIDAWRARGGGPRSSWGFFGAAALAGAGPGSWLAHGYAHHHDAWFFVKRVTDYQRAVGEEAAPVLGGIEAVVQRLLVLEPELSALAIVSVLLAWRYRLALFDRYRRPLLLGAAVLLFLVVGEARGSAPTHHAERALVSVWLLGAVFCGDAVGRVVQKVAVRQRWGLGLVVAGTVGLGVGIRYGLAERGPFVDRTNEVAIGRSARALAPTGRILIDTPDYGFFAVMAAIGASERTEPLDDHDPRRRRREDPFTSPEALGQVMKARRGAWLVTQADKSAVAAQIGTERVRAGRFVLFELGR